MKDRFAARPGEQRLDAPFAMHAEITFIGHIESDWSLEDCPRNIGQAREAGKPARLWVEPQFRAGLDGIVTGDVLVLLYWMDRAPRDLIRQKPRHRDTPTGTFNLRSPARPNPIGMGVVRVLELDIDAGRITIDAIDTINGTPLIDIKPHIPRVDQLPA
ncbi:SAM-dependent methyltransferase [Roseinatronobacter alkalisoli]|uniref:TrmO family methyltransferase n=1 Tax=Roseinatronobacter alkalisoli TaxID=3028235 RepID=A0ABT5TF10_9RHOB|nr:TrmO family methyltransferase [Roseinatronobacter sp. HJB301]MDD7972498.1 TrmO family methyltransferase [Roseinatronobacter sp. HJB301]